MQREGLQERSARARESHTEHLTDLQYADSDAPLYPARLYLYDANGRYGRPELLENEGVRGRGWVLLRVLHGVVRVRARCGVIPVEQCRGCHNDFYNGRQNFDGSKRCWSAKDGRMMKRYRIHYMTAPTEPRAYTEVRKPSCYHQVNQYVFHNSLPDFVKLSDVVREKRTVA